MDFETGKGGTERGKRVMLAMQGSYNRIRGQSRRRIMAECRQF